MWARLAGTWGRVRGGVKAGVRHGGVAMASSSVWAGPKQGRGQECLEEIMGS